MATDDNSSAPEWYVARSGRKPSGPHALSSLERRLQVGALSSSTLIARRGDATWRSVGEVLGRPVSAASDSPHSAGRREPTASARPQIGSSLLVAVAGFVLGALSCLAVIEIRYRTFSQPETAQSGAPPSFAETNDSPRFSGRQTDSHGPAQQTAASAGFRPETAPGGTQQDFDTTPSTPRAVPTTKPSTASAALADQLFLARNAMDLTVWARLGDYSWRDMGLKNYWGHEIGGIDWVTPVGPDSIRLVGQYIDALGTVYRPRTIREINAPFLQDLDGMSGKKPAGSQPATPTSP